MYYRILADVILFTHFSWIIFMLWGFLLTVRGLFCKGFLERWIFRSFHLLGIIYVSVLALMARYCPLTIWENMLRVKYNPDAEYPASFIAHYLEKIVYPDIHPLLIRIPTVFIALFTLAVFIIRPPGKIRRIFIK